MFRFSIMNKMLFVISLCIAFLIFVSSVGVFQMKKIGDELDSIAEADVPLTEVISRITAHQLEQAILFERLIRLNNLSSNGQGDSRETVRNLFDKLSVKVGEEILQGEAVAIEAQKHAHTEVEKAEFKRVLELLKKIEGEYRSYQEHANEILKLANAGEIEKASVLIPDIEKEESKLAHELEDLLFEIEGFTLEAAKTAREHEVSAIYLMISIGVAATIVCFILAIFLVRYSVVTPLTKIVRALDELANDNLDIQVDVSSRDEIGDLARSFIKFREKAHDAAGNGRKPSED